MNNKEPSKKQIGRIGEYLVAVELEKQGFTTSLLLNNAENIDILAFDNKTGKSISIQVKTQLKKKHWPISALSLSKKYDNVFFVFVNLNNNNCPNFYIYKWLEVIKIEREYKKWLKTPGKKGQKHNDNSIRVFELKNDKNLNDWTILREKRSDKKVIKMC